jgi:hypothetical protein
LLVDRRVDGVSGKVFPGGKLRAESRWTVAEKQEGSNAPRHAFALDAVIGLTARR